MHDYSSFVTLTYEDNDKYSLDYRDFQLFMKRLRKALGPVRFYMCGEYGERGLRPHYHALLFGVFFDDRYLWRRSPSGFDLYRSNLLEETWSLGHCEVGDVSYESAGYVARYCLKKVTGERAEDHYTRVVAETGEVVQVEPEFARMSLRPGIGAEWFAKYHRDVYPHDYVMVNDMKVKPPAYYDDLLRRMDGFEIDDVEYDRYRRSLLHKEDQVPERLEVRAKVARARLQFKVRNLE